MDTLTRRSFAGVAAGSVALLILSAAPELPWLTVMEVCWNRNQRWYHRECLEAIAARINKGAIPIANEHPAEDTQASSLGKLRGLATKARVIGDKLQVQCRWFESGAPEGMTLTPAGTGTLKPVEGYPAWHVLTAYRLEYFKVDPDSSFPGATRL